MAPKKLRPGGAYLPRRLGETEKDRLKRKAAGGKLDLKKDFPKVKREGKK